MGKNFFEIIEELEEVEKRKKKEIEWEFWKRASVQLNSRTKTNPPSRNFFPVNLYNCALKRDLGIDCVHVLNCVLVLVLLALTNTATMALCRRNIYIVIFTMNRMNGINRMVYKEKRERSSCAQTPEC